MSKAEFTTCGEIRLTGGTPSLGGIRWKHGIRRQAGIRLGKKAATVLCTLGVVGGLSVSSAFAATTPSTVDTGTLSAISQITGAQSLWNQGYYGQGVGVAVIDTGVAKVAGLNQPGKVIDGPDLSFDSQDPLLASIDAFGHGTHIAGIIAGSDVAPGTSAKNCKTCLGSSAYTDTTKFVGIAPEAKIINVKVGAYDGTVDISQVIAGIDWVVQHRADPGLNIRILNLSFGTDSPQPANIDPLAHAVEQAWNAGIVVVAAGGNDGETAGPLADPAYSPAVIAVGATDPRGTITSRDDRVADFAQHGTADRPVDVAAPGVSVLSLAVPGGFVDSNVSTGKVGTRFQRASGTSQSTAVVSGLSALMLSKYPSASPDAVKSYLKMVTTGMDEQRADNVHFKGAGSANVAAVATTSTSTALAWLKTIVPKPTTGTGLGSLEAARGSYHAMLDDVALTGEIDIFGQAWDPAAMAQATTTHTTWAGGTWNGNQWSGDNWADGRWSATEWTTNDWTGARWSGARWSDAVWDGARWSGARWSGARWSGARWSDSGWDGARWSGARWSGARWSDAGWE